MANSTGTRGILSKYCILGVSPCVYLYSRTENNSPADTHKHLSTCTSILAVTPWLGFMWAAKQILKLQGLKKLLYSFTHLADLIPLTSINRITDYYVHWFITWAVRVVNNDAWTHACSRNSDFTSHKVLTSPPHMCFGLSISVVTNQAPSRSVKQFRIHIQLQQLKWIRLVTMALQSFPYNRCYNPILLFHDKKERKTLDF